jgi:glucokinase
MVGGRLHRGAAAQAGEVYQIPLRGQPLEHFVSGAGVVRGYEAAGGTPDPNLDAEGVAKLARAGDPAAGAAWRCLGEDLAFLCATLIAIIDPAVIVIGGSLSRARDLWGPALTARLEGFPTRIGEAELGREAGVVGAAALNMP